MTLATYEASRYSGEPINLYLFSAGDIATTFAYSDAEVVVEFGTHPVTGDPLFYQPIPIDRGKIRSSGNLDKANLTISTPHNAALAELYLGWPPSSVTSLIIRQGHITDGDADFKVTWTGRVMGCALKGTTAEFTCEPVSTSLRRNGLRRRYQFGCPLVLYGSDCRASKAAATVTAAVAAVSGARITLAADWPDRDRAEKYIQGLAEWTTPNGNRELRTVLRSEGNGRTFLLSGPATGLALGSTVSMILGCNHKSGTDAQPEGDCGPLHDNILNFGGQERIPLKNPMASLTNNFY